MNITVDRAVIKQALEALELGDPWSPTTLKVFKELRTALEQPEQEPVAMVESVATVVSESGNKEITMSWWHEPALPVGTKLYTAPPQRKPLSDGEIQAIWKKTFDSGSSANTFARAIEAAHNIKE